MLCLLYCAPAKTIHYLPKQYHDARLETHMKRRSLVEKQKKKLDTRDKKYKYIITPLPLVHHNHQFDITATAPTPLRFPCVYLFSC
jgi:hypothetical protein